MVKHVIIGTAGHVDHGKTTLIRALTGTDTDRLPEEKRRGITIETGFAHLSLEGVEAAVADVPGHERFIRNMLVGAGQADVALMVVAADEGVKPQTVEHADILGLLGVERGVVALTRCDRATPEQIEKTRQQLKTAFAGSFLAGAPVLEVCAPSGTGLATLRAALTSQALLATPRDPHTPAHLPIDRVFTVPGFGTVVTGALLCGTLSVGESVVLRPLGKTARVRGLQCNNCAVERAVAGQRVAVNLAGTGCEELRRGCALYGEKTAQECDVICVKLKCLPGKKRTIYNGMRMHLHAEAGETLCRVYTENAAPVLAGDEAVAQLVLGEPLGVRPGSRFTVRFFSPVETVGGGTVLMTAPHRFRARESAQWALLRALDGGTPQARVAALCGVWGTVQKSGEALRLLSLAEDEWDCAVDALQHSGALVRTENWMMTVHRFDAIKARVCAVLAEYHAQHPLEDGMPLPALSHALSVLLPPKQAELLESGAQMLGFAVSGGHARLLKFASAGTAEALALSRQLCLLLSQRGFLPLTEQEAARECQKSVRECCSALDKLCRRKHAKKLGTAGWLSQQRYEEAMAALARALEEAPFTLARYRDILGASRKPCQLLLEYFDECGFTRREGELRVRGEKPYGNR